MRPRIFVKEKITGMHKWKDAIDRVDFLKHDHVHDFLYTVSCDVSHDDRDIEFYVLRNSVKSYLLKYSKIDGIAQFGNRSCEMLAREMLGWLIRDCGRRRWTVSVAENPHQGAVMSEECLDQDSKEDKPIDITLKKYDKLVGGAREIFKDRRDSYGNSVNEIDVHTIVGLMRMKLYRIYNEGLSPNTKDELLDTINYAVFALSRIEGDD